MSAIMADTGEVPVIESAERQEQLNEEGHGARPTSPDPASGPPRKRPRLDLTTEPRKRGKSMFGILVGTLNRAKDEDAQRNKSEAARRRMSLETKLQSKLALEQMEIRRQGEIKRTRTLAARKEDDLVIQDSILRLSHRIKPYLSHFLTTSDDLSGTAEAHGVSVAVATPVTTQTALYYLPTILLPEQEAFLKKRRKSVRHQVDGEKESWKQERSRGAEELEALRREAEELAKKEVGSAEADHGEPLSAQDNSTTSAITDLTADVVSGNPKVEAGDAEDEAVEY